MAPLRRRSRPPATFAAANRPRPGSGLSSIVPGKTIEELAERAINDVHGLLAKERLIIIAIERHDAKEWNECHQYAWSNGRTGDPIKRFRELYVGEYEWEYKKSGLQVSLKHNNEVLPDSKRIATFRVKRYYVSLYSTSVSKVPLMLLTVPLQGERVA
ncbi:hypothetical protein KC316_g2201 [Hortaea werneckii]|nr:hypothetical protein KC324_g2161 [Hortaea werneckii]KAI7592623.1 hypothetical protein KC316_g2201 [Hortaea werneckii]